MLKLKDEIALLAAEVSLVCRQSNQSHTEAVAASKFLSDWMDTGDEAKSAFRLGAVKLALLHRTASSSCEKVLKVAEMIHESQYPTAPPKPATVAPSARPARSKKTVTRKKGARKK